MCGIAGAVSFSARRVETTTLIAMCDAIQHRGPDHQGIRTFLSDGLSGQTSAGLGSQRLSIIDVAGGQQPIANEDDTIWTVLNGEIYNFQALRRGLESRGHRFRTSTDTEVIVHLYEEKGDAFVEEIDGMFALAVWDARRERLLLARDRFGKKPLLYADQGNRFRFGSEFQALLAGGDLPLDMDFDALDAYLTFAAVPAPLTIYKAIRKLPPASLLIKDRLGIRISRYWQLDYLPKHQISEAEAIARVRELLTEAVRKRLVGEVPLGAFLSGGVDSTAVVALMAGMSDLPVKTFSIGFDDQDYDELPYAREVAERYGCVHHEFVMRPRAVDALLPTLIRHYGEPYADSSAIPSFYLAQLTRKHVTIALNGDGGDEAFAGYGWHLASAFAERWQAVPRPLRGAAEAIALRLLPQSGDRRSFRSKAHRFLQGAALDRAARYVTWAGVFTGDLKTALVAPPLQTDATMMAIESLFDRSHDLDAVDASLAADTNWNLPNDLLVKMDIATMANSLEARSPFLDHHLVEFVARLPSHFKLRGRTSKWVLKRAVADLMPAGHFRRAKQGFSVPLARWFRDELRELTADHLLGRRATERGFFDRQVIERLIDEHLAGRADHAHRLWVLLMLELWQCEFTDTRKASTVPAGHGVPEACFSLTGAGVPGTPH